MGAGASNFDPSLQGGSGVRFICHACQNVCFDNDISVSPVNGERSCPACNSSFLEEVEINPTSARRNNGEGGGGGTSSSALANRSDLSEDQMRRVANATLMLRLLDAQLRQELDMFQRLYNASIQEAQQTLDKQQKMTDTMRDKLRHTVVDMDMLCSLPSCPICCEDYVVCTDTSKSDKEKEVLQLPCNHFFHPHCVIPWLDVKKTCPICRNEMSNDLPSLQDLVRFRESEIIEKLKGYSKESGEIEFNTSKYLKMDKNELAVVLLEEISKRKDKWMDASSNGNNNICKANNSSPTRQPRLEPDDRNFFDGALGDRPMPSLVAFPHSPNRNENSNNNYSSGSSSGSGSGNVSQMGLLDLLQNSREQLNDDRAEISRMEAEGLHAATQDRQFRAFYDLISLNDRPRYHDDSDEDEHEREVDDDSETGRSSRSARGVSRILNDPRLYGGSNSSSSNPSQNAFHSSNHHQQQHHQQHQQQHGNAETLSNFRSAIPSSMHRSAPIITATAIPTSNPNPSNPTLRVTSLPWMRNTVGGGGGANPTPTPDEAADSIIDRLVNDHMERTGLNSFLEANNNVNSNYYNHSTNSSNYSNSSNNSNSSNISNNHNSNNDHPATTTYIVRSSNNGGTMSMIPIISNRVANS